MENLIRECFFEGEVKGSPFWRYFFNEESRGNAFWRYFLKE
ncbi:hypothetical protein T229_14080 [Tannerella sp. oral taxon BU063 isolate Cell 5]|uniref:Uncharacterized protein n=1 Tax=Tannerella sp. oral taxon BU063 isolate Cell 5 TaxID=1410950 RepID=W2C8W4_9BACT|nr:hypothetical protein T229_14080 [Tannerella sp. oral taxon BU063 isolate Cell 5]